MVKAFGGATVATTQQDQLVIFTARGNRKGSGEDQQPEPIPRDRKSMRPLSLNKVLDQFFFGPLRRLKVLLLLPRFLAPQAAARCRVPSQQMTPTVRAYRAAVADAFKAAVQPCSRDNQTTEPLASLCSRAFHVGSMLPALVARFQSRNTRSGNRYLQYLELTV